MKITCCLHITCKLQEEKPLYKHRCCDSCEIHVTAISLIPLLLKWQTTALSTVVKVSCNLIIQDRVCQNFRQAQWEELTAPDLHNLLHSEEMHRIF